MVTEDEMWSASSASCADGALMGRKVLQSLSKENRKGLEGYEAWKAVGMG